MEIPHLIPLALALALLASAVPVLDMETGHHGLHIFHAPERERATDPSSSPSGLIHPDPTTSFRLFHGSESVAGIVPPNHVDLSKTKRVGDFHHYSEVAGGFYMTDSLVAAAQFACYQDPDALEAPDTVEVVEFQWTGTGVQAKLFTSQDDEWNSFVQYNTKTPAGEVDTTNSFHIEAVDILKSNVIIAGPMNAIEDADLTKSFWQYALIDQATATSPKLQYITHHSNIFCNSVPMGAELTDAVYAQGQGGNSGFASLLQEIQTPNPDAQSDCEGSEYDP
ncbi:hypothetical protein B0H11DRAFT_1993475 [Mycena galericulata]|nr:hypothetical protein B0H11DRAFT_1993475 [Mycena galericulata]